MIILYCKLDLLSVPPFSDLLLIRPPHPPHSQIPIPEIEPFDGVQWADPRLIINKPTKPLDIDPFEITYKQVNSQSRLLEGS